MCRAAPCSVPWAKGDFLGFFFGLVSTELSVSAATAAADAAAAVATDVQLEGKGGPGAGVIDSTK